MLPLYILVTVWEIDFFKIYQHFFDFQVGKLEEIRDMGQDVDTLRDNGILVDAEADPGEKDDDSTSDLNLR